MRAPRGLREEEATGPGPTGGVVGDEVARGPQEPLGPPCLLNGAGHHDQALSDVEGRTEARPRGITMGAGEVSVLGEGTGACLPRGKRGDGCTPLHLTEGHRIVRA